MKLGEIILRNQPGEIGKVLVDHISLVKSDLLPTGPVYTILHRSNLDMQFTMNRNHSGFRVKMKSQ